MVRISRISGSVRRESRWGGILLSFALAQACQGTFGFAFDGAYTAHLGLERHFGVTVGVRDGSGSLTEIVKLTQLVWNARQRRCDSFADALLAIRNDPNNGN